MIFTHKLALLSWQASCVGSGNTDTYKITNNTIAIYFISVFYFLLHRFDVNTVNANVYFSN